MLNWTSRPCASRHTGRLPELLPVDVRAFSTESPEARRDRKAHFAALAQNPEAYAAWVQRVSR